MYNYIDFEFNFNFNKAMKEKVSGDRGAPVSARVHEIFITVLYIYIFFSIQNLLNQYLSQN